MGLEILGCEFMINGLAFVLCEMQVVPQGDRVLIRLEELPEV